MQSRKHRTEFNLRLSSWLEDNRQWTRVQNLGFARRMLKMAHWDKHEENSVFFASVVKAYDFTPMEARIERA